MIKKLVLITIIAALSACGGEAGNDSGASKANKLVEKAVVKTSSPEAAIKSMVANLRGNNVLGLMQTMMPAAELTKARAEFETERQNAKITDAERAQFDQTVQRLTADGAEDALMAEVEPQLAQMTAQLPMMMAFGQMAATAAIQESEDLSADQKAQATETMNATFKAIQDADVGNPELLRMAVGKVCDTARAMKLTSLDDLQALEFEDAIGKASIALGGSKDVLGVYGLSLDSMLDSVETETISSDGDTAAVKVSYTLFGTPQSADVAMTKVDGEWYMKDVIEQVNKSDDD